MTYIPGLSGGGYTGYILIQEQQTQGTDAGGFTSGAWRKRALNTTLHNVGGYASLASNQITLGAGTYQVNVWATAYLVESHQLRLYDTTNATVLVVGNSNYANAATLIDKAFLTGRFTLSGSCVLELQHICLTTKATNGFGGNANFTTEVYASVEIHRE